MLPFALLENGLLRRERGDVIVFNNTSPEHHDTYRFVHDCMHTARQYDIPFYQMEFQTYEDARRAECTRLPTYRLVNDVPKLDANVNEFHWQGEVFKELLSRAGYVPNQFNRICTRHLKLEVTRTFFKDCLASKPTIPRLGRYGNTSRIDPDASYRRHLENQGGVPRDIFLRKRGFAWRRPHFRPERRYEDFCPAWRPFANPALKARPSVTRCGSGKAGWSTWRSSVCEATNRTAYSACKTERWLCGLRGRVRLHAASRYGGHATRRERLLGPPGLEPVAPEGPPRLHNKEDFMRHEHPLRAKFTRLTRHEEAKGLFDETSQTGTRHGWDRRLTERGFDCEDIDSHISQPRPAQPHARKDLATSSRGGKERLLTSHA